MSDREVESQGLVLELCPPWSEVIVLDFGRASSLLFYCLKQVTTFQDGGDRSDWGACSSC
jgi:hypothetical protein